MKMKMFSRLSALLLVGAMTLGLAACGGDTSGTTPAASTGAASTGETDELLGSDSATIRLKVGTTTAPTATMCWAWWRCRSCWRSTPAAR